MLERKGEVEKYVVCVWIGIVSRELGRSVRGVASRLMRILVVRILAALELLIACAVIIA